MKTLRDLEQNVILGGCVILAYFEHLNLGPILKTSSLEYFVTLKKQVQSKFVQYFYSNLFFHHNHI